MLLFLAGMFPAGMIVLMMIAMHIGVKLERICKIGADRAVRAAGYSPKQPDASLPQGGLCPSPNAAADENIHLCISEEACERAMALPVGIHNLLIDHLTIFNIINFKLGGVAKMLKYISVFIGNCDSHLIGSFLLHRLLQGCAACFCASFLGNRKRCRRKAGNDRLQFEAAFHKQCCLRFSPLRIRIFRSR